MTGGRVLPSSEEHRALSGHPHRGEYAFDREGH